MRPDSRLVEFIDQALARYFPSPSQAPSPVREAMHYSLFAVGKRIRPSLCLLSAEALGLDRDDVAPIASAIEFIHTYSLIHDDLPALDDDDMRRGQPTCHKVYGDAIAIMAGDALLTEAFRIIAAEQVCRPPERVAELIAGLGAAAGVRGMVGGQVLDLTAGSHLDADLLREIHMGKTAALIGFSVSAPAIAFGEQPEVAEALRQFGLHLGVAFQIVDDILDETGTAESLGKTPGSDRRQEKVTYVSLLGLEGATVDANAEIEKARACLADASALREGAGKPALKIEALETLTKFVLNRKS